MSDDGLFMTYTGADKNVYVVVGRVGGQSFLYFGLHSDYVGEHNVVKGTIKFFFYKLF